MQQAALWNLTSCPQGSWPIVNLALPLTSPHHSSWCKAHGPEQIH